MLDLRWTVRQLEVNGLLSLDDNLKLLIDHFRYSDLCREETVKRVEALEVLASAVQMAWPLVEREKPHLNR